MDAGLSVSAEEIIANQESGEGEFGVLNFDQLHLSLAGEARCNGDEEAGAEQRCQHCLKALADDLGVVASDDDGTTREVRVTLHTYGDSLPGFCDANMNGSDDHEAEYIPGSFANSARVIIGDNGYDTVTVTISVGDPRGAFAMSVHRNDDGQMVLSVPDPSDGFPHMTLTADGPGRFLIS